MKWENPYYTSCIPTELDYLVGGSIKRMNRAGSIFVPSVKLHLLEMKRGMKVNVGLNRHQNLILAMAPEVIQSKIESVLRNEFMTRQDKDIWCFMLEDFAKFTEMREVNEDGMLRIPAKIREMENLKANDKLEVFVKNRTFVARKVHELV